MNTIFAVKWWVLFVNILFSMGLGMVWYSPKVFFKIWQNAQGITDQAMKEGNPGKSMLIGLGANAVSIYALGVLIRLSNADGFFQASLYGGFFALFLVTAAEINNGAFRMTKPVVYCIDGGYRVLVMMVAAGIYGALG